MLRVAIYLRHSVSIVLRATL